MDTRLLFDTSITWFRASDLVSFLLGSRTRGRKPDQALVTSPRRTKNDKINSTQLKII